MQKKQRVAIIGAGFSGLYLARELQRIEPASTITLYEAAEEPGGKCVTAQHGEKGPWRIHSSHTQVLRLVEELRLTTSPNKSYTAAAAARLQQARDTASEAHLRMGGTRPGHLGHLAVRDEHYWTGQRTVGTGYPGLELQASAPGVAKPTYSADSGAYLHVVGGMAALVGALAREVLEKGATIEKKHFLRAVLPRRRLRFLVANEETRIVRYDRVYLCLPVHHLKELQFPGRNALRPLLAAVEPYSLNHCYFRRSGGRPRQSQAISADGQWVPALAAGQWEQFYTGGEVARTWNRARYRHKQSILGFCRASEFRMHFWPAATYTWRPSPVFTQAAEELDLKCMFPLTAIGAVVLSESLSRNQGWLEGACSNVHHYLEYRDKTYEVPRGETVAFGAYRVPWERLVKMWAELHPGGGKALENYRGTRDWSQVLERIPHSDEAWAHVFHLATPNLHNQCLITRR